MTGSITAEQYDTLKRPLNGNRVASRNQGGKSLSYLEAWDVRAHLIRVFGYGNFDVELLDYGFVAQRDYKAKQGDTPMVEVIYHARVRLALRDAQGGQIAVYSEGAVGAASGPLNMLGDHHDNALKTAESDALKRCAINLGTQFGLSLYANGSRNDVVRWTLVKPEGHEETQPSPDQQAALEVSVGSVTPEATPEPEAEPTIVEKAISKSQERDLEKHRRQMFAIFSEKGFTATGDAAREERIGYCNATLDKTIESSSELSYDDITRVIEKLKELPDVDKAGAKA